MIINVGPVFTLNYSTSPISFHIVSQLVSSLQSTFKLCIDMDTTCFESSILELWANDGVYDNRSDEEIANVTSEGILERINSHNLR